MEKNEIKVKILEIILSRYDEKKKISIALPEIASGDFVIKRSPSGNHRLKLIACRKMIKPISPHELIAKIITTSWQWGNKRFSLVPEEPVDFFSVFQKILGEEKSIVWFKNLWEQENKLLQRPVVPAEYIKSLKKISTKSRTLS